MRDTSNSSETKTEESADETYRQQRRDAVRKILIMGLPGAGKTTLARLVARRLGAVHFNADEVRQEISQDLGFREEDRLEHARRMGWLCDRVVQAGGRAVADFVCPTEGARLAFQLGGPALVVHVDRIRPDESRFADTAAMFVPPAAPDVRVTADGAPEYWCERVASRLSRPFDPKWRTALMIGRFQPFHDGHRALALKALEGYPQLCIAVRDTVGAIETDVLTYHEVEARIRVAMADVAERLHVIQVPNVASVVYGRDVGYALERIELDPETERISATGIRRAAGTGGRQTEGE